MENGEEEYSERGIDVPGESKISKRESKKNKKVKQGQYVIDIEPLTTSNNENYSLEPGSKTTDDRKDEDELRYQFIRGTSGRSTIDGSGVSGSLDVHFHTGTAPSPILTGPSSKINEVQNRGSGLAKSYLETDLPVYEQEIDDSDATKSTVQQINDLSEYVGEKMDHGDDHCQGPPQVWISKSLSMEQGINKLED